MPDIRHSVLIGAPSERSLRLISPGFRRLPLRRYLKNEPDFGHHCGSFGLVSLVSVGAGNWFYTRGTVEAVETGETLEIVNIHAVFIQVAEKMVG